MDFGDKSIGWTRPLRTKKCGRRPPPTTPLYMTACSFLSIANSNIVPLSRDLEGVLYNFWFIDLNEFWLIDSFITASVVNKPFYIPGKTPRCFRQTWISSLCASPPTAAVHPPTFSETNILTIKLYIPDIITSAKISTSCYSQSHLQILIINRNSYAGLMKRWFRLKGRSNMKA